MKVYGNSGRGTGASKLMGQTYSEVSQRLFGSPLNKRLAQQIRLAM